MNEITQSRVEALASKLLSLPQASCNVRHLFYPGLYIRELTAQAGTFAIGYVHKTEHMNVMLRGVVRIVRTDGTLETLRAPLSFLGKPGRNMGFIDEEMVWLNIYPTECRDVEELDRMYLEPSPSMNGHVAQMSLLLEHTGFEGYLNDVGMSLEEYRRRADSAPYDSFPIGEYKVKIGRSEIEGKGLICTSSLQSAEIICPAFISGRRTPAGRYTNHSDNPNAVAVLENGNVYLVATKEIQGCSGGFDGEEITIDYRQGNDVIRSMLT